MKRFFSTLFIVMLLSVISAAQDGRGMKKRVFVITAYNDSFSIKAAGIYHYYAKRVLSSSKEYQLIEAELALEDGIITPNKKLCAEASTYYNTGKRQFENMELELAKQSMSKALSNYWRCPAYIGNGAEYLETLKMLGAIYIMSDEEKMGKEMFKRALLFNPDTTINKDLFPPNIIQLFNKVKVEVAGMKRGSLNISTIPQGGEVFIDGVFVGISPLIKRGIVVGNHFVSIEKDGYINEGGRVDINADEEEIYQAQLIPTKRYADYSQVLAALKTDITLDPIGDSIRTLAAITGADIIFANMVWRDGTEILVDAYLFDIASKSRLFNAQKRFNYPIKDAESEIMPFILEFISGRSAISQQQPVTPLSQPTRPVARDIPECKTDADCMVGFFCNRAGRCTKEEKEEERRFYKQWWFYSAIGGALLLITGGTILLWPSEGEGPSDGVINFKF